MLKVDPSQLPGTHRTRVFVGGSYELSRRSLLDRLSESVRQSQFDPIVADAFKLINPELDVHDVTLNLLHSCRVAIFELSALSGALMEVERCADYNIAHVLVLYQDPYGRSWPENPSVWKTTAMLKSLVLEDRNRFRVRPYFRPQDASSLVRRYLSGLRRSDYGQLHGL